MNSPRKLEERSKLPIAMTAWWFRYPYLIPLLVLSFSLALTYRLYQSEQEATTQRVQENFDFRVRQSVGLVSQRLLAYAEVLRGARGLFAASNHVNRDQFRDYVEKLRLEKNYGGLQGIGFSLIVPPALKDKQIAAMHKEKLPEGVPTYRIWPEGKRSIYTSIIYLEPFSGRNLRAFGYDMYSEPVRHAAMDQARDTNMVAASGKVILVQENGQDEQAGFLMYLPVYKNHAPYATVAERRANIVGWVYEVFRMRDLMHGILGERESELDFEIFGGEEESRETLIFDSDQVLGSTKKSPFQSSGSVDVAGLHWKLQAGAYHSFYARIDTRKADIIAKSGIGISLLLSLVTWLLLTGQRRAYVLASKMNHELIQNESELRIAATAFESQEGILITDAKSVILRVNNAFTKITGYSPEEVIGKNPRILSSGRQDASFYAAMWGSINNTGAWEGEIWNRRKNGEVYPEHLTITAVKNVDGAVTNYVATITDITLSLAAADEIKNLAYFDPLTRLPNRRLLQDRLQQALVSCSRNGKEGAILFIDLDNFKDLNDAHGHEIGDLLLEQVAGRLITSIRQGDTVARLGGDEFVVMLEELSENALDAAEQVETVAKKILYNFNQPYQLGTHLYHGTTSIGVTLFSGPQQSEELMKQADIAMYQAKKAGRNTLRFFDQTNAGHNQRTDLSRRRIAKGH